MANLISCLVTNLQVGQSRFKNAERPKLKSWRCEFTALSHVYNLYFVAYGDVIHVYQPTFPRQDLPDRPALILRPPVSSPDLGYVLDQECPHSINRLHLDFLGREEIVLVVCDDGDVIGYSVTQIQRAIEQRAASEVEDDDDLEVDVRVFLHRNVGVSGWGLAVHQQGRMIAISANSHQVTVIAYALANLSETDPDSSDSSAESRPSSSESLRSDFPYPRRKEHILTLQCETNIPSISFDNNGTDPAGRWLFSSSIDGATILWDLHNPIQPARILKLGRCVNTDGTSCSCLDRHHIPHAAWHAMFLDTRSCRKSRSFKDAFGAEPVERAPCYWDITSSKPSGLSQFHNLLDSESSDDSGSNFFDDDAGATSDHTPSAQEEQATESDVNEETENDSESEDEQIEHGQTAPGAVNIHSEHLPDAQSLFIPEQTLINDTTEHTDDTFTVQLLSAPSLIAHPPLQDTQAGSSASESDSDEDSDSDSDSGSNSENEGSGLPVDIMDIAAGAITYDVNIQLPPALSVEVDQTLEMILGGDPGTLFTQLRQPTKKPYFHLTVAQDGRTQPPPPTPTMPPAVIVTKQDIYLVQPRHLSAPPPTLPSHANPAIMLQFPHFFLGAEVNAPQHDRLCYATQIPELGIVLAASPAGKVAIMSLTQIVTEQTATKKSETVYGMKLDHVVPSTETERECRALQYSRLVGMAVGPVQGMLDTPADDLEGAGERRRVDSEGKPRRWRLILMYLDHTVVSYELGMQRENDEASVADLMV